MALFFISAGTSVFSQKLSGDCLQKDLTRELCKTSDSLSRFMNTIKKNSTADAWANFERDAALGPVAAFDNFDERSKELRETFTQLCYELDRNAVSLISAIDPAGTLTGEQLKNEMIAQVSCYYQDIIENDLKKLIKDGGGPLPERLDNGPCENEFRSCKSNAASAHTSNLISCGFGAGAFWRWLGGIFGGGAGLICLVAAETTYNNAKMICFTNYCQCVDCSH